MSAASFLSSSSSSSSFSSYALEDFLRDATLIMALAAGYEYGLIKSETFLPSQSITIMARGAYNTLDPAQRDRFRKEALRFITEDLQRENSLLKSPSKQRAFSARFARGPSWPTTSSSSSWSPPSPSSHLLPRSPIFSSANNLRVTTPSVAPTSTPAISTRLRAIRSSAAKSGIRGTPIRRNMRQTRKDMGSPEPRRK